MGVPRQLFDRCEEVGRVLLHSLTSGDGICARHDLHELAFVIDLLLGHLLVTSVASAGYWSDGVEFDMVEVRPGSRLVSVGAMAWCADHRQQWRVPLEVAMDVISEVDPPLLARVSIHLGDGMLSNLKGHLGRRPREPARWLCMFSLERPGPDRTLELLLGAFEEWLALHPDGRIVDHDWRSVTRDWAREMIHARVALEAEVNLRPTWLDGGPALHIECPPSRD